MRREDSRGSKNVAKTPKPPQEAVADTVEDAVIVEETSAEEPLQDPVGDETPQDAGPEEAALTLEDADEVPADADEDVAEVVLSENDPEEPDEEEDTSEMVEPEMVEDVVADADATEDTTPEDVTPTPEPAPATATPRRGGFAPMVLGGVIAAGLGFVGAQYPDQWPFPEPAAEADPVAQQVAAQADRLEAVEQSLAEQATALGALASQDALTELGAQVATDLEAIQTKLADLETRLTAVEKLPTGDGTEAAEAAAAAYQRELAELRAMFDAELAKVSAVQEDAEALSANAATRAALANVMAALDSGAPFADSAAELAEVTGAPLPDPLPAMAADGVPTLAALQDSFPDAARAALDIAIKAAVEDGSMSRTQAFLRSQLGVRSLEPKEGDDADAILSRAEEALRHGQIPVALTELAALPEAAQPAMADWISTAKARVAALDAGQALATQLNK